MSAVVSPIREPLVTGAKTYHQITEDLISPTERTPPKSWVIGLILSIITFSFGAFCLLWTIWHGIGTWNLNRTIGWGWDITNFVWWIGIGHAGTLISAILLECGWQCSSSLIQIQEVHYGLTSTLHYCGMYLRSLHTLQYLFFSGTLDLYLILQRLEIELGVTLINPCWYSNAACTFGTHHCII